MRRILKRLFTPLEISKTGRKHKDRRFLARFTGEELGDLSTLANPKSVEKIKERAKK